MSRRTKSGCPICGAVRHEKYTPFCSAKCADRDLAKWLSGHYAIPAADDDADSLDENEGIERSDAQDPKDTGRLH